MTKKQKLELTWIGKENRPRLEPWILPTVSEDGRMAAKNRKRHKMAFLILRVLRFFAAEN